MFRRKRCFFQVDPNFGVSLSFVLRRGGEWVVELRSSGARSVECKRETRDEGMGDGTETEAHRY